jgi:hypothetical protein
MHIPKTAGTTLRTILSAAFPMDVFPSQNDLSANAGLYLPFSELRKQRERIAARRFIMGHYTLPQLRELFPERDIITCLREPFARTVSVIKHFSDVDGTPPHELLTNVRFLEQQVINNQLRFLTPGRHAKWTVEYSESLVDQALQSLERVKIVGIQERFPQFIAHVAAELQFPSHTNCDRRENVSSADINDQLAPFTDQIHELIAGDLELYRQVCLRAGSQQVP